MSQPSEQPRPVALVTGGARRVGAEIVRRLHADGIDIALHYGHSADAAAALAAELDAVRADSVAVFAADLAGHDAPRRLVEAVLTRFGRLDGLVNNASAFCDSPLALDDAERWHELFAVNAQAPLALARAAAPALRASRGAIVNLIDIYAERPQPRYLQYAASKAALASLTRGLALTLAPEVRVNGVAPGAILWPDSGIDPARRDAMIARTPLQRLGTPAEVASTVRFLLLEAGFVTGQIITVDGGRTLAD